MSKTRSSSIRGAESGVTPIWSRPVVVEHVPEGGLEMHIEADEQERAALAALDGLVGIAALAADFTIERQGRDRVRVHGTVTASLTQTCVVSLEPFEADVAESVDVVFAHQRGRAADAEAVVLSGDDLAGVMSDPPDQIIDGRIDLGALASEFFTLGLDPYPRKPGVEFHDIEAPRDESDDAASPFAALDRLGPAKG